MSALVLLSAMDRGGAEAMAQLYVPNMMQYTDAGGNLQPVTNPAEWEIRRQQIIGYDTGNPSTSTGMQAAMGNLPDRSGLTPSNVQVSYGTTYDLGSGYTRTTLTYYSEHDQNWVPAVLYQPTAPGVYPGIMALHQTNFTDGKNDTYNTQVAISLAQRGYVVLAPDYPSFGQYTYNFASSDLTGPSDVFGSGNFVSGCMKALADEMRGVDLLQSLSNVDPNRIGSIGHSLGGGRAIILGAFDERVKATVSSCGWGPFSYYEASFDSLYNYSHARFMPRVDSLYGNTTELMPFDWSETVAALAPRAFLAFAANDDPYYCYDGVNGVEHVMGTPGSGGIQDVYDLLGAGDNLQAVYTDTGHAFTLAMQQQAFDFFDWALPIPEPNSITLLCIGAGVLLACARRRRR